MATGSYFKWLLPSDLILSSFQHVALPVRESLRPRGRTSSVAGAELEGGRGIEFHRPAASSGDQESGRRSNR